MSYVEVDSISTPGHDGQVVSYQGELYQWKKFYWAKFDPNKKSTPRADDSDHCESCVL